MRVTLMRGIPGSGKTHFVQHIPEPKFVVSADSYFTTREGAYVFVPAKIREAHAHCLRMFLEAIHHKHPHIVVDNTNTSPWQIAPYAEVGLAYGYTVEVVEVRTPLSVCMKRNLHGAPESTIRRMEQQLHEPLPKHWRVRVHLQDL